MKNIDTNSAGLPKSRRASTLRATAIGLAALVMLGTSMRADDMYQPAGVFPGGVKAQSFITNISVQNITNTTVAWEGLRGRYSIQTNGAGTWGSVGTTIATNYGWSYTFNNGGNQNLNIQLIQTNFYAGSGACSGCHGDKYSTWTGTLHGGAYSLIITNLSLQTNDQAYCTVGYNQGTGYGYTNVYAFSNLVGNLQNVGCENCHGPAGWHKYGVDNTSWIRPAVTVAAEVCGGCHDTADRPTYTEWTNSMHAIVPSGFITGSKAFTNPTNGPGRMMTCGPCHSAATRLAMINDYKNRLVGITNKLTLPSGHDAAAYGQTCAVCHDPHSPTYLSTNIVYTTNVLSTTNIASNYGIYTTNVYYTTNVTSTNITLKIPHQLRNPMWSSNFFTFYPVAATNISYYTNFAGTVIITTNFADDGFLSQYNPNINLCGQCHNNRGARWDGISPVWNGTNFVNNPTPDWSRAPHNSPQYNILIGIAEPDYLNTIDGKTVNPSGLGNGMGLYASHSGIAPRSVQNTNQCATCHVPLYTDKFGVFRTDHTFNLDINGCALGGCHTGGAPNYRGTQATTTNRVNSIVALLRAWSTSQGPVLFPSTYQNYGQNAWEYTSPGTLTDGSTNQGPSAADQLLLPTNILQARYDLYMVNNDGSKGVHNPTFLKILMGDAETKVLSQINAATNNFPTLFKASINVVWTNTWVLYTNLTVGLNSRVTNCVWNFDVGNSNISITNNNTTVVSNYYTSPGSYKVSLTTIDTNGNTGNMTIPSYINVLNKPVPNFTYTPGPYTFPSTVSFTNTSANADYFVWVYMNGVSSTLNSLSSNPPAFTYTNPGIYQVKLTAYNEAGSVAITNTIGVGPYASFTASSLNGVAPFAVTFTTNASVGVVNYNWSFGDGNNSNLPKVTNTYVANGAYTLSFTVDNGVLTNTLTYTNYINVGQPLPAFTANTTNGAHPLAVSFTNLSSIANSYKWIFAGTGLNITNTSVNPSFTFTNAGSYNVTLQAINTGATNVLTQTNYIIAN